MTLSQRQIDLVQTSFQRLIHADLDRASQMFYRRLFEIDPSVQPLFKDDLTSRGRKLMQMILFAVNGLNEPDDLLPQLRELGQRHAEQYGVQDEHYATLGAALLWTLAEVLGETYTPETRRAWNEMYRLMAQAALEGAYKAA